ncbi:MAG TPA: glycosyltransferase [Gammaproteobacteria bacterium]|nr:glycosyltransferase [Gammaproteobacteria bacterium]
MRLLNVIASTNPEHGGVIEWVRQFGTIAVTLGHQVEVASLDDPDAPWVTEFPLTVHALGHVFRNFYSPKLTPWLIANRHHYDAVLTHGLWRYPSFGTWRALRASDTPHFIYTHGMLDPWFKHEYPLKHLGKWLYWPWTDYRALRDATGVIFTCEQEKLKARKSFWLYRARELVTTIGITAPSGDPESQRRLFHETFPETSGKHTLLFLGRIHPKKGCDLLIRTFAKAATSAKDLHLVIAGPDNTHWAPTLKQIANDAHISDRITWTGMISDNLKWGAFHAAEAFILPSHQENFGIAVVEAMACGTPVLISDKVDIFSEILSDNAGFVSGDTQNETNGLVQRWLDTPQDIRDGMGRNALASFRKRFEVCSATQGLLDLLQQEASIGIGKHP